MCEALEGRRSQGKASSPESGSAAVQPLAAGGGSPRIWQKRPQWKTGAKLAQAAGMEPRLQSLSGLFGLHPGCFTRSGKQEACHPAPPQQRWVRGAGVPTKRTEQGLNESIRGTWVLFSCLFESFLAGQTTARRQSGHKALVRNRPIQAGTNARTHGHLPGRERIADRTGKYRRGERLPCCQEYCKLTARPRGARAWGRQGLPPAC